MLLFLQDVWGDVDNRDKQGEFEHVAKRQHLIMNQDDLNFKTAGLQSENN